MDIDTLPYIPARLQKSRPRGTVIKWAVVHDMESPETGLGAENCARWFQDPRAKGSAHINVDNNSCVRSVKDERQAAAAPGSNTEGVHVEITGYARQTLAEWMDAFSIAAMDYAANCVAQWLKKYNLPNVYRDASALRAGLKGWTTHWQVSIAFKRSTHTDPGPNFPIAYFQSRINHYYYDAGDFDLSDEQFDKLMNSISAAHAASMIAVAEIRQVRAMVAPNLDPNTNLGGDTPWWNTHYTMSEVVHIRNQVNKLVESIPEVPSGEPTSSEIKAQVGALKEATMKEDMPEIPSGLKPVELSKSTG